MIANHVEVLAPKSAWVCIGVPGFALVVDLQRRFVDIFHDGPNLGHGRLRRFRLNGDVPEKGWSKRCFCPVFPVKN